MKRITLILFVFSWFFICSHFAFAKWIDCNNFKLSVDEKPAIEEQGLKVYYSMGTLILADSQTEKTNWCKGIGRDWNLEGFRSVFSSENSQQQSVVFEISGEDSHLYFDINNGKEVYVHKALDGRLFISDKPEEAGKAIEVVDEVTGAHSNITEREYQRILNRDDFAKLWQRHTDNIKDMPKVDFNSNMVVAIFSGKGMNNVGVGVIKIRELDDALYFYFRPICRQTAWKGDKVESFGIFVIPRSNKKLILEQNIQNLIDGPEKWKVVKEFEAIP